MQVEKALVWSRVHVPVQTVDHHELHVLVQHLALDIMRELARRDARRIHLRHLHRSASHMTAQVKPEIIGAAGQNGQVLIKREDGRFVTPLGSRHDDPQIMEAAAAQCLMLTGFFYDQLAHRHQMAWYATLGAGFYDSAAHLGTDPARAAMMGVMAVRFDYWRRAQRRLSRDLRDSRLLVS